ncbi:PqqD family protein [Ilumatobacter sp.]|uniref:PqqD family protein n=1 Tax=Ilumatobacter sp. TaxID=1967498 RepID=UPI003C425C81
MSTSETATSTERLRPRPHASVETAFLPPDVVLFDDRHGEIHHLNSSASAVWMMLDGDLSIPEVADELSEIFSVPSEQLRPDVDAAVEDFRARGLLDGTDQLTDEARDEDARTDAIASEPVSEDVPLRLDILGRPPDT